MRTQGPRNIPFQPQHVKKQRRKNPPRNCHTGIFRQILQKLGLLIRTEIPNDYLSGIDRKRLEKFYFKLNKFRPTDLLETLSDAVEQGKEVFVTRLVDMMSHRIEAQT